MGARLSTTDGHAGEAGSALSSEQVRRIQSRSLATLVVAQVFSGAGLAAGITVGALLAQEMLDSTGWSGLPAALFTFGSAAAALLVGRISQRWGRRPGLAAGYAAGAVGSLGILAAAVLDNVALLFVALFVYGSGTATNLQARYAGADLARPDHRARALSIVLVATTAGAVAGPNLVGVLGDLAEALGIPRLTGPFLLAAVAYGAAAVVIAVSLRPDPLLVAATLPHKDGTAHTADGTPAPNRAGVLAGAAVMVVTQLVMVAIMTMTPVYMQLHHHELAAAGLVISIHVAAMYLPAPISGMLVDRLGVTTVGFLAAAVLAAAGLAAGFAPPESVVMLAIALALLGFGWSLGLVAGTTAITNNTDVHTRARTQGTVDVFIAVAGAGGGLASGFIVAVRDFTWLGVLGAAAATAIVPILLLRARVPAGRGK
ncbi:MAG: MFS transporter [Actinomycetota bacterium]|nr:MFS transporter [Actinomycetota bacterium]